MTTYGSWTDQPTYAYNVAFGGAGPTAGVVASSGLTQHVDGATPPADPTIISALITNTSTSGFGGTGPVIGHNGPVTAEINFSGSSVSASATDYSAGRSFGPYYVTAYGGNDAKLTIPVPAGATGYEFEDPHSTVVSLQVPSLTVSNYNEDTTIGGGLAGGSWTTYFRADNSGAFDSTGTLTSWSPGSSTGTVFSMGQAASAWDIENRSVDLTPWLYGLPYEGLVLLWSDVVGQATFGDLSADEQGVSFGAKLSNSAAVYTMQPPRVRFIYPDPAPTTHIYLSPIRRVQRGDVQAIGGVPRSVQNRSRQSTLRRGTTFS